MSLQNHIHCDSGFAARFPGAFDFVQLFEYLPGVVFYAKNHASCYIAANTAMLESKRLADASEFLGSTDADYHPPLLAEAYVAEDRRIMAADSPLPSQLWFVLDPRGKPGWFASSKVPLHSKNGTVIGIAGVRYAIDAPADRAAHFKALDPVIKLLEKRYQEPWSMKDLAKVAGLSTTHFNRQFIKLLGVSPTQLLHAIRIDRARDLLVRSDQCIVEIAIQVGYYDQSHFTRHFRKQCGLTPRSYRARFRK